MIPVFEAVVARRLLVNYRLDPGTVRALLPPPLEPLERAGAAMGGVSLVRIERLRPRGFAPTGGLALEVLAHRVAVTVPGKDGRRVPGSYVIRRDVERRLVVALGGRLFGGAHRLSRFEVEEDERHLRVDVFGEGADPILAVEADWGASFRPSASFGSLEEASRFFVDCEQGLASGRRPGELEAVRLAPQSSRFEGVRLVSSSVRLFEDEKVFAKGTAELDSALGTRSLPLEWVAVREVPEIRDEPPLPMPA